MGNPKRASQCPDEDTLARYVAGGLDPRLIAEVEEHVNTCTDCRSVVAATMKASALRATELAPDHDGPPARVLPFPTLRERVGPYELLAELGEGGMGIVYKARSVKTGALVALKRVKASSPVVVASLRREIHALRSIEHPGVVRVLDQGMSGALPWYAMELVEGETLEARIRTTHAGARGTRRAFADLIPILRVVRRLCETLSFLHGKGGVHRDLTPRNVIIRPGDLPVVVDFGLTSLVADPGREMVDAVLARGGTPSYMAPEQIENDLVDARADLYALGCILYEILTGHPPFVGSDARALLHDVLTAPPPPPPSVQQVRELPPELADVTMRLLARRPRDRLGYAQDVVRVLDAVGITDEVSWVVPRSRSYSYRPALVGRTAFMATFDKMLARCRRGQGGRIFLAGASGAGKTRLAVEAAARARRGHVLVVSAGCAALSPTGAADGATAAGATLHAFRPLLLAIADLCRHKGAAFADQLLGARGKVLAACEPDLATLPGQVRYPDPPALPAEAARFRLLAAMEATLGAFVGKTPLVLVLDDLQWADELSIAFLESLDAKFFARHPVLILGTYRNEEADPEVQRALAAIADHHYEVGRLDDEAIAEMVGDMLALEHPPPRLVAFLARESEGNPLFITAYLHLAVEEGWLSRDDSGQWRIASRGGDALSRDESLPIPASLKTLLERHIAGLTPEAGTLIEFASVLGRTFEPQLLAATWGSAGGERLDLVNEVFSRQILESAGADRFRFVHDKIREAAYGLIAADRLPDLHRAAALAIEAAAEADDPVTGLAGAAHAVELAHHWRIAGEPARESPYRRLAGERAFRVGSYRDTIFHLERALELVSADEDPAAIAVLERQLAEAHFGIGDMATSRKWIEILVARVGLPMPKTRAGMLAAILADIVGSLLRRALEPLLFSRSAPRRQAMTQAARAYERLAHILFFQNQLLGVNAASVRALGAASRLGPSSELARVYGNLSLSAGLIPAHGLARALGAWALRVADEIDDEQGRTWARQLDGVYQAGLGHWSEARANFETALAVWDRIGDRRRWEETLTLLGMARFHAGDFADAADLRVRLEAAGLASGSGQTLGWALIGQAEDQLQRGNGGSAIVLLERALDLGQAVQRVEQIWLQGLMARARLMAGDVARARVAADSAFSLLRGSIPTAFYALEGYSGVAEVYLSLARQARLRSNMDDSVELVKRAKRALRFMRHFALVFPIARTRADLWRGVWRALHGDHAQAHAVWSEAASLAKRSGRDHDLRLLREELSGHMDADV